MVNRDIRIPLYIQVYEAILEAITRGTYSRGQMLPPEKELGLLYQVDRQTVRRSLELLVDEGLVEKRAGVGSFIRDYGNRSESVNGSGTVVFILPGAREGIDRITEPFNAKLFSSIEKYCRQEPLHLTYMTVTRVEDLDRLPSNVAGVFAVSRIAEEVIEQLIARDIPVLVTNDYHASTISILADSFNGAREGVDYLIGLGHRRIGFIGGIEGYVTAEERFGGYMRALIDAGLPWDEMPRADGGWTFDGGFRAMQTILRESEEPPTAIFAANDMMAFGAIHAIRNAGIMMPEQISVLGFDDIDQCRYAVPPLSTIGVDVELTAQVAAQNLFRLMRSRSREAYKIIIPTRLFARGSTVPPVSER